MADDQQVPEMTPEQVAYCEHYANRLALYEKLLGSNVKRERELMEKYGVGLDRQSRFEMYVRMAIDRMMPPDTVERIDFEIAFQQEVSTSITAGTDEARKRQAEAKLGVDPKGLVLPPPARTGGR